MTTINNYLLNILREKSEVLFILNTIFEILNKFKINKFYLISKFIQYFSRKAFRKVGKNVYDIFDFND
jgi:hypothetical protein